MRHSKSLHENLANIREVMDAANQQFEATAEQYRLLARKNINQADLRKYVKRVLKVEDKEEISHPHRQPDRADHRLCETGRGNDLPSVAGHLLGGVQRRVRVPRLRAWSQPAEPARLPLVWRLGEPQPARPPGRPRDGW